MFRRIAINVLAYVVFFTLPTSYSEASPHVLRCGFLKKSCGQKINAYEKLDPESTYKAVVINKQMRFSSVKTVLFTLKSGAYAGGLWGELIDGMTGHLIGYIKHDEKLTHCYRPW